MTCRRFLIMGSSTLKNLSGFFGHAISLNFKNHALLFTLLLPFLIPFQLFAKKTVRIESIKVNGSTRITDKQVVEEFDLYRNIDLSQQFARSIITRMLGMGLFEKANLIMKKGSEKGKANLNINLKDDPSVVGDWAIGTNLQLRFTETHASAFNFDGSPLNIKGGLIARNAFGALHRLGTEVQINSEGDITEFSAGWGLPKFAASQTQFDFGFHLKRPSHMYLDLYGFAIEAYGIWSFVIADKYNFRYGVAGLANRRPLFALPYYPSTIVGPYVEIGTTTSFASFLGDNGYNIVLRLIPSVGNIRDTYVRLDLDQTFTVFDKLQVKYGGKGYLVGDKGYGARFEVRLGHPFGGKFGKFITDTSEIFFKILQIPSKNITNLFSGD